jgi:hypothetical protein
MWENWQPQDGKSDDLSDDSSGRNCFHHQLPTASTSDLCLHVTSCLLHPNDSSLYGLHSLKQGEQLLLNWVLWPSFFVCLKHFVPLYLINKPIEGRSCHSVGGKELGFSQPWLCFMIGRVAARRKRNKIVVAMWLDGRGYMGYDVDSFRGIIR